MNNKIKNFEKKYMKKKALAFDIGDTVDVYFRITEGDKTRLQLFNGIVIARRGSGINESVTVRRISFGEGVERVFPVNSPLLEKINVVKKGKVNRAKLYYLRGKKGKQATKVEENLEKEFPGQEEQVQ